MQAKQLISNNNNIHPVTLSHLVLHNKEYVDQVLSDLDDTITNIDSNIGASGSPSITSSVLYTNNSTGTLKLGELVVNSTTYNIMGTGVTCNTPTGGDYGIAIYKSPYSVCDSGIYYNKDSNSFNIPRHLIFEMGGYYLSRVFTEGSNMFITSELQVSPCDVSEKYDSSGLLIHPYKINSPTIIIENPHSQKLYFNYGVNSLGEVTVSSYYVNDCSRYSQLVPKTLSVTFEDKYGLHADGWMNATGQLQTGMDVPISVDMYQKYMYQKYDDDPTTLKKHTFKGDKYDYGLVSARNMLIAGNINTPNIMSVKHSFNMNTVRNLSSLVIGEIIPIDKGNNYTACVNMSGTLYLSISGYSGDCIVLNCTEFDASCSRKDAFHFIKQNIYIYPEDYNLYFKILMVDYLGVPRYYLTLNSHVLRNFDDKEEVLVNMTWVGTGLTLYKDYVLDSQYWDTYSYEYIA